MALKVFDAIAQTGKVSLRFGQDVRATVFCALVMSREILDVYQHSIDDPWHRHPCSCNVALLGVTPWTFIARWP